jgi:heptosyltransferase-2
MEKILVAQTGFLGDLVLTTPLLQALRSQRNPDFLAVLCTPHAAELLQDSPLVDEVIPFDKKGKDRGWGRLLNLSAHLREYRFTHVLAPHKSLRTATLLALSRIPLRIGFRESPGWFLYHTTVRQDRHLHSAERILSLAGAMGVEATGREGLSLRIGEERKKRIAELFQTLTVADDKPLFGIQPGSIWATKRWVAKGYAQVALAIQRNLGGQVLILGGAEDCQIADEIIGHGNAEIINLVGLTTLGDLMAVLKRLRLLITNDTGPMHIAVALRVPVVAVFCSTTRDLGFYPYSNRAVVVEKSLSCRPCAPHGRHRCPIGTEECMRGLSAVDVLRGVDLILGHNGDSCVTGGLHVPHVISV